MQLRPWKAFWSALKRQDGAKRNSRWMALRNALAVSLPLGIGIVTGNSLGAVAVTTGALNVSYSDGRDPYAQRARRMLAWSLLGAFAVFTGSVTGKYHVAAILLAAGWAFAAGMLISIGSKAGDLGLNTLVVLLVFAARGALLPTGALTAAGLVLTGGLLQSLLALFFWPFRRDEPERRAIGNAYLDLAQGVDPHNEIAAGTPLRPPSAQMQDVLSALGRDHSIEGERFRLLFDQIDRLRLSLFSLNRLRSELEHNQRRQKSPLAPQAFDELLAVTAAILKTIGEGLLGGTPVSSQDALVRKLHALVDATQARKKDDSGLALEFASAVDALAGQVRLAVELAGHTTKAGAEAFASHETAPSWKLQLTGWVATLRANLDLRSAIFRHAIRLAVCVALADAIGRSISWQRSYWLPMTVAVVLKPDFTTTLSRGALRLFGTYTGLILATLLYLALPHSAITQVLLVGTFTFFLRWVGPANYGVFSVVISGLIVFLIAETGVPPSEVVLERFLNTSAGGVFALLAYVLWPTWERKTVSDVMADMLDACRAYFHAVTRRFTLDDSETEAGLDETRREWRRARSSAEASVDRVASEPGTAPASLDCLMSMLASSHSLVHAIMGLEAGVIQSPPKPVPAAFRAFAKDAEFTLYFLAAALRGSHTAARGLPKLRDDHRRLLEVRNEFAASDEIVLIETDRLTASLNTLSEQVLRYLGSP